MRLTFLIVWEGQLLALFFALRVKIVTDDTLSKMKERLLSVLLSPDFDCTIDQTEKVSGSSSIHQ